MNSYQKRKQELAHYKNRSKALEELVNEILLGLDDQEKFDVTVDRALIHESRANIYQRLAQINIVQPTIRAVIKQ